MRPVSGLLIPSTNTSPGGRADRSQDRASDSSDPRLPQTGQAGRPEPSVLSPQPVQAAVEQRLERLKQELGKVQAKNADGRYDQREASIKARLERIHSTEQKRFALGESLAKADQAAHKLVGQFRVARAVADRADGDAKTARPKQTAKQRAAAKREKAGGGSGRTHLEARLEELKSKNHDGKAGGRLRRLEGNLAKLRNRIAPQWSTESEPSDKTVAEPLDPPADPPDPLELAEMRRDDGSRSSKSVVGPVDAADAWAEELQKKFDLLSSRFEELSRNRNQPSDRLTRFEVLCDRFDQLMDHTLSRFEQDPEKGNGWFEAGNAGQINAGLRIAGICHQVLKGMRASTLSFDSSPLEGVAHSLNHTRTRLHAALQIVRAIENLATLHVDGRGVAVYEATPLNLGLSLLV